MSYEEVVVETFKLDLTSDQCGYPIFCPGEQPRFVEPQFFVGQLANCGIEESQLRRFFDDAKEIFHDTGMPMFPCIFHHFCLPFSPICAAAYCSKKRKVRLDDLVREWNETYALHKGLYLAWNEAYLQYAAGQVSSARRLLFMPQPGIELRMNVAKRREFCASRGIAFNMPEEARQSADKSHVDTLVDSEPPPYRSLHHDHEFYHTGVQHGNDIDFAPSAPNYDAGGDGGGGDYVD